MANLNPALSQSLSLVLVRQCFYIGDDELRVLGQLLPQVICFGVGEIYVGDVQMAQVPLHLLLQADQRQNDQSQPASPQIASQRQNCKPAQLFYITENELNLNDGRLFLYMNLCVEVRDKQLSNSMNKLEVIE